MSTHVDALAGKVGQELGVSDWVRIDQEQINLFADATGDHQWIHVDEQRAAEGRFGSTIAHGYLTLSMLSVFLGPILEFDGVSMQVNYGLDKVRFPQPVPVGSRLRARVSVDAVDEQERGVLLTMGCVIELEGTDKPACVASPLALLVRS